MGVTVLDEEVALQRRDDAASEIIASKLPHNVRRMRALGDCACDLCGEQFYEGDEGWCQANDPDGESFSWFCDEHRPHVGRVSVAQLTKEDVLRRWPRITAHLISESLGYFTPNSAAGAVLAFKFGKPYFCEWYSDWAHKRTVGGPGCCSNHAALVEVGEIALRSAVADRHRHKGFMADYGQAMACVAAEKLGRGPVLASWF